VYSSSTCVLFNVLDTEDFLGDADEDLEAMQSTVYLLQQELKEAKERIYQQLVELTELRATLGASQLNCSETNLTPLHPPQNNSHADFASRTDDVIDNFKREVVNNSALEEQELLDNTVRSKQQVADTCSKHSGDSMDVEADSTTGLSSASCKNHVDHCRTKSNSDKLCGSAEDSNGKKALADRSRTSSTKVKTEQVDGLSNGVTVLHTNKNTD